MSTTCTKRQVEHGHQSQKGDHLLENNIRNKSRGLWVVNQLRIRLLSIVNQQNVTEVMENVDIYRVAAISGEKSVHPSADGTSKRPPIRCHFLLSFAFRFIAFQLRPSVRQIYIDRSRFSSSFVVLGLKCFSCSSCVLGTTSFNLFRRGGNAGQF